MTPPIPPKESEKHWSKFQMWIKGIDGRIEDHVEKLDRAIKGMVTDISRRTGNRIDVAGISLTLEKKPEGARSESVEMIPDEAGPAMTPREKILRDGLRKIEKREWVEIEKGPPFEGEFKLQRTLSGENAREAIAAADAVKDGPSEEDRERFLKYVRRHTVHVYDDIDGVCYKCWAISLLKKYMRIE